MPEVKQEQGGVGGASESIVHVEDYGRWLDIERVGEVFRVEAGEDGKRARVELSRSQAFQVAQRLLLAILMDEDKP